MVKKNGQEVVFAEMDSSVILTPNLESRLRLAVANIEDSLRQIYGLVSAAEQDIVNLRYAVGRAERVPFKEGE